MRAFVLVAVAVIVGLTGCGTSDAHETLTSCRLLTRDDIAEIVGFEVKPGRLSASGDSCDFTATDAASGARVALLIIEDDDKHTFDVVRDTSSNPVPLSGLGDEAYVWARPSGGASGAEERSGNARHSVTLYGEPATAPRAEALLRRLSVQLLSR